MSFVKKGASAFGKLFTVMALAGTFLVGAVGVVYLSLQGEEMKVPEIVGKDLVESEKELASLGLKIKKRADRFSEEKPNTILEQLPKAGETVKTGQMILVVTSKTNPEGEEKPATIKKNTTEEDDSEKIEELISDKPKKTNKANQNAANANKKKTSTTRDVIGNSDADGNSNSNSTSGNSNTGGNSNAKGNSNSAGGVNKNAATNSNKANSNQAKPPTAKPATGGDVRPRRTPQP